MQIYHKSKRDVINIYLINCWSDPQKRQFDCIIGNQMLLNIGIRTWSLFQGLDQSINHSIVGSEWAYCGLEMGHIG